MTAVSDRQRELLRQLTTDTWRTPVFAQLILDDLGRMSRPVVTLEIGCGLSFDGDPGIQRELAGAADLCIGVEPDPGVEPQAVFGRVFSTTLEGADIEPGSVDLAYSVMVMEHVDDPRTFMEAIHTVLKPGGVYWGFTIDRRHWYSHIADLLSKTGLKSRYLDWLYGRQDEGERYLDYPTTYKLNAPGDFGPFDSLFSDISVWNTGATESVALYAPRPFRGVVRALESWRVGRGGARSELAVRLVK